MLITCRESRSIMTEGGGKTTWIGGSLKVTEVIPSRVGVTPDLCNAC